MAKKINKSADTKKIMQQIKEMEKAKRDKTAKKEIIKPTQDKVSFNDWYARRKEYIPNYHKKEVIWADFKARKIKEFETMEKFDAALKLYGINI
jgi:hypothetical protein